MAPRQRLQKPVCVRSFRRGIRGLKQSLYLTWARSIPLRFPPGSHLKRAGVVFALPARCQAPVCMVRWRAYCLQAMSTQRQGHMQLPNRLDVSSLIELGLMVGDQPLRKRWQVTVHRHRQWVIAPSILVGEACGRYSVSGNLFEHGVSRKRLCKGEGSRSGMRTATCQNACARRSPPRFAGGALGERFHPSLV